MLEQKPVLSFKKFQQKYDLACSISSLISLVLGLSFERLLNVLVYTNFSDTKEKSFWRYFDTGMHVRSWYEVNDFPKSASGD